MIELATTNNFFKKVQTFFKYHWQFAPNDTILADAFNLILQKAKKGEEFEPATEYCGINGLEENGGLFYKYSVYDNGVYFIFVVCPECGGKLKCVQQCKENSNLMVCFQDLWVDGK